MIQDAKIAGNVLRLGVHSEWMAKQVREYIEKLERDNYALVDAVISMSEDGWLLHGPEGMSKAQEKCCAAYLVIKPLSGKP